MEFIQFYDHFNEVEHGNIKERERVHKIECESEYTDECQKMNENNQ